jgi:hypothetical protein
MSTESPANLVASVPARVRPFLAALGIAVAIDAALRWWIVATRGAQFEASTSWVQSTIGGTVVLHVLVTVAFFGLLAMAWRSARDGGSPGRRMLLWLGLLASATLLADLIAVNIAIYRRNTGSYALLAQSFALYAATNMIFVFWYWFYDHPLRVMASSAARTDNLHFGIKFPEERRADSGDDADGAPGWRPGLVDYAYFTLLSSNCFGSPEGHVVIGRVLKLLQIVHTVFMIFIFIIIIARAINTLG